MPHAGLSCVKAVSSYVVYIQQQMVGNLVDYFVIHLFLSLWLWHTVRWRNAFKLSTFILGFKQLGGLHLGLTSQK